MNNPTASTLNKTDNGTLSALEGVRVLELGQLIAGPFCGQLLADLGAEVIKIELPGRGDPMREWGKGEPVWWPVIARNKKCITLDVRTEQGRAIIAELVEKADIVLENFRPGTMEKWRLGYADLAALNKGIIMVRVPGMGSTVLFRTGRLRRASARLWGGCATSSATRPRRRAGSVSV